MNNQISEDLPTYFEEVGLKNIEVLNANEVYEKGAENFMAKAGIWTKVAESRGIQIQAEGYTTEEERLQAISEYNEWINSIGEKMIMKLEKEKMAARVSAMEKQFAKKSPKTDGEMTPKGSTLQGKQVRICSNYF